MQGKLCKKFEEKKHFDFFCLSVKLSCQFCQITFLRKELDNHITTAHQDKILLDFMQILTEKTIIEKEKNRGTEKLFKRKQPKIF